MRQHRQKRNKIAFFGHFNSSNFGNESTLQAILYNLRRYQPNADVLCLCTGPQATIVAHQIEAVPISETLIKSRPHRSPLGKVLRLLKICIGMPKEWFKGFIALRHANMLVIPGLGQLTDAFGLAVPWGPVSIFKWSLIAKACGCKLLFVSVGAGPIYGGLGKFFVKSALSLADFRSYRDDTTKQCLSRIGFRTDDDHVYPDLVFSLPAAVIPHDSGRAKSRPVVGLGLMAYVGPYSGMGPSIEIQHAYLENLAIFVIWLLAHNYDVRLLIGDLVDQDVVQDFRGLLRRLPEFDDRRVIYEPFSSVEGLLSQIAATDIVVATRFHNVLLSLLCDKPVIAISFHHKCESLMNAVGLSAYCLDIDDLKADRLIEKFCDLSKNTDNLRPLVRETISGFRKELDKQYQFIFNDTCHASERRD